MASTVGTISRAEQLGEAVLNGVRRSRFSLHFNTRRVRRWLLVQFVSAPVQTADEQATAPTQPVQSRGPQATIGRLMDDFMAAQFARRLA